mgnify:FL=1
MDSTLSAESYFRSTKRTEMYKELFQFLLLHKELPVPGIGTFLLEKISASVDFPNKQIIAPAFRVSLSPDVEVPEKGFFHKLSGLLHQSTKDTVMQFNDFVFNLKKQVMNGAVIDWKGIGILQKGLSGDIRLIPASDWSLQSPPVAAEKVIREKAAHMVRVGEDEKTSTEMTEMLNQPEIKKSYWWVYAMVVGILSVIFIGWHLSEKGLDLNATGNGSKLIP